MSTETRARINIFAPFMQIFATGIDIDSIDENSFDDEQKASQSKVDKIMEESSEAINVNGGKTSKKGGFVKKMDTNPEIGKAMREKRDQVVKEAQEKGIEL